MPTYEYEARDKLGHLHRGIVEASNPWQVQEQLRQQGLWVTSLREQKPPSVGMALRTASPQTFAIFFRHLHACMRAGISLAEALTLFAQTEQRSPLRQVAEKAALRLAQGTSLSQALTETRFIFPPFVLPMVQTGEKSGKLDETFHLLKEHFEREHKFQQELRWRTFYPRLLAGIAIVMMLIITIAIPLTIQGLRPDLGFYASHYQQAAGGGMTAALLLAALFFAWALWKFLAQQPFFASVTEIIRLSVPWFSSLPRLLFASRFARALAMMVSAGVETGQSLEMAGEASGSWQIKEAAKRLSPRLQRGENFSAVLTSIPLLPPIVVHMVATGERSGTLDEGLNKAAEFLESEADVAMRSQAIVTGIGIYLLVALIIGYFIISFWANYYGGMFREFIGTDQP